MNKYEVCDYLWSELDLVKRSLFMEMNDGAKFDVSLNELSDDDVKGLMTDEDYDMNEEVFKRLMWFAVRREDEKSMKSKTEIYNALYDMVNYTHISVDDASKLIKEDYDWFELFEDTQGRKLLLVIARLDNNDDIIRYFVVD